MKMRDAGLMKKGISAAVLLLVCGFCVPKVQAANRLVPGEYSTIQAAIDAAVDSDTVIVATGTYYENISFKGKNIVLTSTNPEDPNIIAATVINGGGKDSVVTFAGTETPACLLTGFTITGGHSSVLGGGIRGNGTRATIIRCIITGNIADDSGGGAEYCIGLISHCIITHNHAKKYGGGLCRFDGTITNCLISHNSSTYGGGISGCGNIINCTIVSNTATNSGGGLFDNYGDDITNSIFWANSPDQIMIEYFSCPITYSCVQGGADGTGNIDTDPWFVDPANDDYRLQKDSHCIDAGARDIWSDSLPAKDLAGNLRQIDGNSDGIITVDMGAYEYGTVETPLIYVKPSRVEFAASVGISNPVAKTIYIRNMGIGTLNWHIIENCSWLNVSPAGGSSTAGQTNQVALTVDTTSLSCGYYSSELIVSGDPPCSNPVIILVTLIVHPQGGLRVPADSPTIQAAIDVAVDGETVIVSPCTYYENISFKGKNIVLTSTNPEDPNIVAATVINGGGKDSVVTFAGTETPACLLTGFTITGGYSSFIGGGITGNGTRATIIRCIITGNIADDSGGGAEYCIGLISHCIITHNRAKGYGGGLCRFDGTITNCLISHNSSTYGGGISGCGNIINCTIVSNTATDSGGGLFDNDEDDITNSIFWANSPDQIKYSCCNITSSYSCVQGGADGIGNIDTDPQFVDSANDDYHLLSGSPCIDAGIDTWYNSLPAKDLAGNFRQIDGNNDGIVTVDMGAYEYGTVETPLIFVQPLQIGYGCTLGGTNPAPKNIYISNVGVGTLNWFVTENSSWLQVHPTNGISIGEFDNVALTVDSTGLSVGTYTCNLVVDDIAAANSPVIIPVILVVYPECDHCIHVPADFPTIQAAIDAAFDSDIVIVDPGTYTGDGNRDIDFKGKKITVRSTDPNDPNVVAATIVDCSGSALDPHRGFYFHSNEDVNSVLDGLTITRAYSMYSDGAGICCEQSSPLITRCIIKENHGGGIYYWSSENPVPVIMIITDCTITNNIGSGIRTVSGDGRLTIDRCIINGNSSGGWRGGGISCEGESNVTISNCTVKDNTAEEGAGIFLGCLWPVATVKNCTIENNIAKGDGATGGGICCIETNATITNCIIRGNKTDFAGGAVCCYYGGSLFITNCNIENNIGGGIRAEPYANDLTIDNCIITGNSGPKGAGINCGDADWGGVDKITINNCIIKSNTAEQGAGINFEGARIATVENCVIENNIAKGIGARGGGSFFMLTTATMTNCIISGNKADNVGGAMCCCDCVRIIITNCSIVENSANNSGGGMYCYRDSNSKIINSILWGNEAITGPQIYARDGSSISIYFTDIEGGRDGIFYLHPAPRWFKWGAGNIDADPCFADPCNNDYHISLNSPCINTGDPNYVPESGETDLDGRPRIIGGRVDMGAYEFNHIPVADAGPDQTVYADSNCTAEVTLDGSVSYDEDGDKLTYIWKLDGRIIALSGSDDIVNFADFAALAARWSDSAESFGNLSSLTNAWLSTPNLPNWDSHCDIASGSSVGPVVTVNLPVGKHHIELIVNDGLDNSEPDEVVITVLDNTPPEFTLSVTPTTLWPPNHKMVRVTPGWTVTDLCDPDPNVSLVNIRIYESGRLIGTYPDSPDIQVDPDGSINLRAERSGGSTGRIYSITYQAVDDAGNTTQSSATVTIPHDQGD